MRHLLVTAALSVVLMSGAALAQSGQGGYLGKHPGTDAAGNPPTSQAPSTGSGQGGYLGKSPGGDATSSGSAGTSTMGSGQGGYLGKNPGSTDSTYGKTGGGRDHR
jgi:hypothetical protein